MTVSRFALVLAPLVALAGCGSSLNLPGSLSASAAQPQEVAAPNNNPVQTGPTETLDPTPAPAPRPEARTVEEFDTTTAEDRAEALAAPEPAKVAAAKSLGTTVGSLGSPTDPGIWIKTPLVTKLTPGRVKVVSTGKTVNVELRPSGGAAGSGSQVSLAAMRLMGVPLTELPKLELTALPG